MQGTLEHSIQLYVQGCFFAMVSHNCVKLIESMDSYLTRIKKPCIMIDKETLLLKSYLLELLINNRYTHKEKKQWQKLEL